MFYKLISNKIILIKFFMKLNLGIFFLKNYFKNSKNIYFIYNILNYKIFWKNKLLNYYDLYINSNLNLNYVGHSLNSIILLLKYFFYKKKSLLIIKCEIINLNLKKIKCTNKIFLIN